VLLATNDGTLTSATASPFASFSSGDCRNLHNKTIVMVTHEPTVGVCSAMVAVIKDVQAGGTIRDARKPTAAQALGFAHIRKV